LEQAGEKVVSWIEEFFNRVTGKEVLIENLCDANDKVCKLEQKLEEAKKHLAKYQQGIQDQVVRASLLYCFATAIASYATYKAIHKSLEDVDKDSKECAETQLWLTLMKDNLIQQITQAANGEMQFEDFMDAMDDMTGQLNERMQIVVRIRLALGPRIERFRARARSHGVAAWTGLGLVFAAGCALHTLGKSLWGLIGFASATTGTLLNTYWYKQTAKHIRFLEETDRKFGELHAQLSNFQSEMHSNKRELRRNRRAAAAAQIA